MAFPFAPVAMGVYGLAELLKGIGVFKDPAVTADENRRRAMKEYLENNMPTFDYKDRDMDESEFADVLNPVRERMGTQEQGFGNAIGLRGLGRSGVGAEMALQNNRRNTQDVGNLFSKISREQKDREYKRALDKYNADLDRAKTLAGLQE